MTQGYRRLERGKGFRSGGPGPQLGSGPRPSPCRARYLTDFLGLLQSIGTVVPVLRARDVGHAPLVAVPSVEAIHLERPESGHEVRADDETVGVADLRAPDAERLFLGGLGVGTIPGVEVGNS